MLISAQMLGGSLPAISAQDNYGIKIEMTFVHCPEEMPREKEREKFQGTCTRDDLIIHIGKVSAYFSMELHEIKHQKKE